jgi:hypothetical protein
VICPTTEAKYFCEGGLDDPNQLESAQQIRILAHADFLGGSLAAETMQRKIGLVLLVG